VTVIRATAFYPKPSQIAESRNSIASRSINLIYFAFSFFSMTEWLQHTLFLCISVGFVLGYPSLDCPESSSSRWCEVHSNQLKWPPMVPSSPAADGWSIGKFALPTNQGLQGNDAICGQDIGGTQW
jgi:hypothetical protein